MSIIDCIINSTDMIGIAGIDQYRHRYGWYQTGKKTGLFCTSLDGKIIHTGYNGRYRNETILISLI